MTMASETMIALQWDQQAMKLVLNKQREKPKISSPNDLIIKVAFAGLCGTDIELTSGAIPMPDQCIPGHENSGIVHEIGENVPNIKVGDRVCMNSCHRCGTCKQCMTGNPNVCPTGGINKTLGVAYDGGMAQYVRVKAEEAYVLADDIPLEVGSLCEPMSALHRAYDMCSPIADDDKILVIGCGPAGILLMSLLHFKGFRNIVVTQRSESRRSNGKNLGLRGIEVCHPVEVFSRREKNPSTGLFDVIIDTVGTKGSIEQYHPLLNSAGKYCIYGLRHTGLTDLSISLFDVVCKEQKLFGTIVSIYFPQTVKLVENMFRDGYLDLKKMGVKLFKIENYEEAFRSMICKEVPKVMFELPQ